MGNLAEYIKENGHVKMTLSGYHDSKLEYINKKRQISLVIGVCHDDVRHKKETLGDLYAEGAAIIYAKEVGYE